MDLDNPIYKLWISDVSFTILSFYVPINVLWMLKTTATLFLYILSACTTIAELSSCDRAHITPQMPKIVTMCVFTEKNCQPVDKMVESSNRLRDKELKPEKFNTHIP